MLPAFFPQCEIRGIFYSSSYEAEIALVVDVDNCDEAAALDVVEQIADAKFDCGTMSVLH